jgi:hypothetical protein
MKSALRLTGAQIALIILIPFASFGQQIEAPDLWLARSQTITGSLVKDVSDLKSFDQAMATDEMRHVRDKVALMDIPYYAVSFVPMEDAQSFFQYCDSLDLGVPVYLWIKKDQSLTSLSSMVAPSHFLLDKNGVIIRTWPGSNGDKMFRTRMAKQIVDDTSVIVDTLAAVMQQPTLKCP